MRSTILRRNVIVAMTIAVVVAAGVYHTVEAQRQKAKFSSKTVTSKTPGRAVDIDVDISGAKKLYLVVTDGGNGYACDWADWAEPRLVGPKGELKLTDLKWKMAKSSWGSTNINQNAAGRPLRIDGKQVKYGIGTHANSVIAFDLPKGYKRFKARGGLDNGGTDQNGGGASSVQFQVYLDKLPKIAFRAPAQQSGGRDPKEALEALDVADGLEAKIFAAEPMLLSPSNIDIDAKGRVWVCEVVNYRRRNGTRKEGDRILVLEDTDADGKADKKTVFYQGRDIDSVHGVCVLGTPDDKGTKVIVSVGENVFLFTDTDGDLKADSKKVMFTGISGKQHDHGIHAFIFGPDGKLYFNFGNVGNQIKWPNGKPVIDMAGNVVAVHRKPYQQGLVFRCNLDGSDFETLGWNFRNNWEVTTDSFGTLWQSDNDDDGNRGVRINYVMEFGNYGYRDELTAAGWRSPRTGMAEEVPLRHWHLNDPGVVPNLLQTGAGSPTGIMVYEGRLLPKRFWDQVIHCDAGPNIVRAYPVKNDGAGYKATIADVLHGARDRWFRPSDVCVAPDGSLLIADWYDPGVGGHGMGDIDRGRIFRVAPPKTPYKMPEFDFSTPEGAAEALKNPALSVRYIAWQALHNMQDKAEPVLKKMFADKNPRFRARALWLLGKIKGRGKHYVDLATSDQDPNIRIVGLRLARQLKLDVLDSVAKLADDPSPQVRRECAIALRAAKSPRAAQLWAELASRHDGKDRWYLEALGIAANGKWNEFLNAWLKKVGDKWDSPAGRDIIWRSRADATPAYLAKIISDESVTADQLPRYFRALDFQDDKAVDPVILQLAFGRSATDAKRRRVIESESLNRLRGFDINSNPKHQAALDRVLDNCKGTEQYVELVNKFNVKQRFPDLMELAYKHPNEQIGVDAIVALMSRGQQKLIRDKLAGKDVKVAVATAAVLGNSKNNNVFGLLMPVAKDGKADLELRREAVRALGQIKRGAQELVKLAKSNKLDSKLKDATAASLHQATWKDVKAVANQLFPLPATKNKQPIPALAALLKSRGDAKRGAKVFATTGTCANCHVVNKEGKEVGPNLSEIGSKLSRQAMFESILFPSAAISHNYETYLVALKNGTVITGLMISKTPASVSIKDEKAIVRKFKASDIDVLKKQSKSLMPADLMKVLTPQDLIDIVSYMTTLKKQSSSLRRPNRPQAALPLRNRDLFTDRRQQSVDRLR